MVDADQGFTQWRRLAGIAVFTYLTAAIYKCNEVIKKEVALKSDSSRFMVTVLGTIAAVQALSFLIVLYRQELWLNFIMVPREGSVKGVRALEIPVHTHAVAKCSNGGDGLSDFHVGSQQRSMMLASILP